MSTAIRIVAARIKLNTACLLVSIDHPHTLLSLVARYYHLHISTTPTHSCITLLHVQSVNFPVVVHLAPAGGSGESGDQHPSIIYRQIIGVKKLIWISTAACAVSSLPYLQPHRHHLTSNTTYCQQVVILHCLLVTVSPKDCVAIWSFTSNPVRIPLNF